MSVSEEVTKDVSLSLIYRHALYSSTDVTKVKAFRVCTFTLRGS